MLVTRRSARRWIGLFATAFLALLFISACGTLDVSVEGSVAEQGAPGANPIATGEPGRLLAETPGASEPAVAWYGSVHTVPGSGIGDDYFKPWHLAIWPKFGRAVGLTGIDPSVEDEIERLRDQDIKATLWGDLTCNVADYGGCRLLVTRISADDGGPQYEADKVEGWQGQIGRLPVQPGSQNELLYFVLEGPVIALYGIASDDPAIQTELERLAGQTPRPEGRGDMRIWGELDHKAQPMTGTLIEVERLEES
jgi:hypothetical protein